MAGSAADARAVLRIDQAAGLQRRSGNSQYSRDRGTPRDATGIVSTRLDIGSCKQRHTIAKGR